MNAGAVTDGAEVIGKFAGDISRSQDSPTQDVQFINVLQGGADAHSEGLGVNRSRPAPKDSAAAIEQNRKGRLSMIAERAQTLLIIEDELIAGFGME